MAYYAESPLVILNILKYIFFTYSCPLVLIYSQCNVILNIPRAIFEISEDGLVVIRGAKTR